MYNVDTKVILHHDGRNEWFAPTEIKSICKTDVTFFPFEEQTCLLTFGSWTYNSQYLDLALKSNTADLKKHPQWTVDFGLRKCHEEYRSAQLLRASLRRHSIHCSYSSTPFVLRSKLDSLMYFTGYFDCIFVHVAARVWGENCIGDNFASWADSRHVDFHGAHSTNIRSHSADKHSL